MSDFLVEYHFRLSSAFSSFIEGSVDLPWNSELPLYLGTGTGSQISTAYLDGDLYRALVPSRVLQKLDSGELRYFIDTEVGPHGGRRLSAIHITEP